MKFQKSYYFFLTSNQTIIMGFALILLSALVVLALVAEANASPKKEIQRSLEMDSDRSRSCEELCDLVRSCVGCTEDGHPIFPPGQGGGSGEYEYEADEGSSEESVIKLPGMILMIQIQARET